MGNTYKCALCEGVFKKVLTDKEAEEQFKKEFPGHERREDDELTCDDCYKKIMAQLPVSYEVE